MRLLNRIKILTKEMVMPAKDGTGPLGQGSRTGRGIGKCKPTIVSTERPLQTGGNQSLRRGGRLWSNMIDNLFGRKRTNRVNRK